MAVIIYLPQEGARTMAGERAGGTVEHKSAGRAPVTFAGADPPCPVSPDRRAGERGMGERGASLGLRAAIFGGGITIVSRRADRASQGDVPVAANESSAIGDKS